jgi:CRISPR type I-E-associated protein CasB/Cse2
MTQTTSQPPGHAEPDALVDYLIRLCSQPGSRARLRRTLTAADPSLDTDVLVLLGAFIPPDLDERRLEVTAAIAGLYATFGSGAGTPWWTPGSELGASVHSGSLNEERAERVLRSLLRPSTTRERIGHLRRVLPSCSAPDRIDWARLRRDLNRLAGNDPGRVAQRWARDYAQQLTARREGDPQ